MEKAEMPDGPMPTDRLFSRLYRFGSVRFWVEMFSVTTALGLVHLLVGGDSDFWWTFMAALLIVRGVGIYNAAWKQAGTAQDHVAQVKNDPAPPVVDRFLANAVVQWLLMSLGIWGLLVIACSFDPSLLKRHVSLIATASLLVPTCIAAGQYALSIRRREIASR